MKDEFDKYIIDNKEDFDVHEPDLNIWDRIEETLPQEKKKTIRFMPYLKYAAAIVILLAGGFMIRMLFEQQNSTIQVAENTTIQINIPEVTEAEAYYSAQVNEKMKQLFVYTSNDPSLESEVKVDLMELDSIYSELKKDLKDNVANEEVIQAMIQNYRLKLEILEDILSMLENDNQDNNKTEQYDL